MEGCSGEWKDKQPARRVFRKHVEAPAVEIHALVRVKYTAIGLAEFDGTAPQGEGARIEKVDGAGAIGADAACDQNAAAELHILIGDIGHTIAFRPLAAVQGLGLQVLCVLSFPFFASFLVVVSCSHLNISVSLLQSAVIMSSVSFDTRSSRVIFCWRSEVISPYIVYEC